MKKNAKEIFSWNEKQKEIAYCIFFLFLLIFLTFGDKIAMHFIKEEPNTKVFGEIDAPELDILFLDKIDVNTVLNRIQNKETFLLYISSPYCDMCKEYENTIKEVKDANLLATYYIEYKKIKESEQFLNFMEHQKELPNLIYFKNGKYEKEWPGVNKIEDLNSYFELENKKEGEL